jgi:hypothetical protein
VKLKNCFDNEKPQPKIDVEKCVENFTITQAYNLFEAQLILCRFVLIGRQNTSEKLNIFFNSQISVKTKQKKDHQNINLDLP